MAVVIDEFEFEPAPAPEPVPDPGPSQAAAPEMPDPHDLARAMRLAAERHARLRAC
jgi:hypothetical protein